MPEQRDTASENEPYSITLMQAWLGAVLVGFIALFFPIGRMALELASGNWAFPIGRVVTMPLIGALLATFWTRRSSKPRSFLRTALRGASITLILLLLVIVGENAPANA